MSEVTARAATLVVFSGLPGVGKTTIARLLAGRLAADYLRIDTIEQAVRRAGIEDVGAAGYSVANALAAENVRLGRLVVADCVNPVAASREGWRAVAAQTGAHLAEIRVICSDAFTRRRRLQTRRDEFDGVPRPSWDDIGARRDEPWDGAPHHLVDTAATSVPDAVAECVRHVEEIAGAPGGQGGPIGSRHGRTARRHPPERA